MTKLEKFMESRENKFIIDEEELPEDISFDRYIKAMVPVEEIRRNKLWNYKVGLKENFISSTSWVKKRDTGIPEHLMRALIQWSILKVDKKDKYVILPVHSIKKIHQISVDVSPWTYSIDPQGHRWNYVNGNRFIHPDEEEWLQLFFEMLDWVSIKIKGTGEIPELSVPEGKVFNAEEFGKDIIKCFTFRLHRVVQVPWKEAKK